MKKILLTLALLYVPSLAWAQCSGVFPPASICGNNSGVPSTPKPITTGGPGTVTSFTFTDANGFHGVVTNPLTTPTLVLSNTVNGIVKSNGAAMSAATSGTDYAPATSGSSLLRGNGSGGFTNISNFTANLPLIGDGTSIPVQGTRTGNTTAFATSNGSLVNGHCVSIDSSGNFVDAGGACTTGGGGGTVSAGTANQLGMYASSGTVITGLATANNGILATSSGGVPSIASTIPAAVQANITATGILTTPVNTTNNVAATSATTGSGIFGGGIGASGAVFLSAGHGFTTQASATGAARTTNCSVISYSFGGFPSCLLSVAYTAGTGNGGNVFMAGAGPQNLATFTPNDTFGVGSEVFKDLTSGDRNIGIGNGSWPLLTTGSSNISIGYETGSFSPVGISHTIAIGDSAGAGMKYDYNIAIGPQLLQGGGTNDIAIGAFPMGSENSPVGRNIAIGNSAGATCTTCNNNLFLGLTAGFGIVAGAGNVVIGTYIIPSDLSNTIAISDNLSSALHYDYGITNAGAATLPDQLYFSAALTTDAGKTDNTLCRDTTTGQVYRGSGTAGICLGTSSARFKHNIKDLDAGLKQILAMRPREFYLNEGYGDPTKLNYGFIAEESIKTLPKLVAVDSKNRPTTFDYLGVVPVLVKAIQEQQAEIAELKKQRVIYDRRSRKGIR